MNSSITANLDDGLVILVVGLSIVFVALLALFAFFEYVVPVALRLLRRPVGGNQKVVLVKEKVSSGEEIAAVAAAVYLYLEETHDLDNPVITISKSPKDYSPWSSKIYATHHFMRTHTK